MTQLLFLSQAKSAIGYLNSYLLCPVLGARFCFFPVVCGHRCGRRHYKDSVGRELPCFPQIQPEDTGMIFRVDWRPTVAVVSVCIRTEWCRTSQTNSRRFELILGELILSCRIRGRNIQFFHFSFVCLFVCFETGSLTLSSRVEYSGTISAHCSLTSQVQTILVSQPPE